MKQRVWIFVLLIALLMTAAAQAKVVTRQIAYTHDNVALEGMLAYDDETQARRPAILVVHEWWGLNDYVRHRAEKLAAMGYVAFAADMYGKGKVTNHPKQAGEWSKMVTANTAFWQQRALAGLKVLMKQPQTDPQRIAAIGYCFGGGTVQQLVYAGAPVKGVVSFHGALQMPPAGVGGKTQAKILMCHGGADPFAKPEQVQAYLGAMEQSGLDYQFIIYGGAKHGFTNPGADAYNIPALGYNANADRRSWKLMQDFFAEIFAAK